MDVMFLALFQGLLKLLFLNNKVHSTFTLSPLLFSFCHHFYFHFVTTSTFTLSPLLFSLCHRFYFHFVTASTFALSLCSGKAALFFTVAITYCLPTCQTCSPYLMAYFGMVCFKGSEPCFSLVGIPRFSKLYRYQFTRLIPQNPA